MPGNDRLTGLRTLPEAVTPTPVRVAVGDGRPGVRDALASEWTKLRTLRSAWWSLVAVAASILGFSVFVGATESLQPDDTVLGGSLTGAAFGQLVAASFGVLVMAREYATGTIRTTLMGCPRRLTVLAAKAVATAVSLFAVALPACSLAYLIG